MEGTWESDCVLTLKSRSVFTDNTLTLSVLTHDDLNCTTVTGKTTLDSGTYTIGADVTDPAGVKELNFVGSSTVYTVYTLTGDSLNFTLESDTENDGSTEAKRIRELASGPVTRQ